MSASPASALIAEMFMVVGPDWCGVSAGSPVGGIDPLLLTIFDFSGKLSEKSSGS